MLYNISPKLYRAGKDREFELNSAQESLFIPSFYIAEYQQEFFN
jgi:hypothetical protein